MELFLLLLGALIVYFAQAVFYRLSWNRKLSASVVFRQAETVEGDTAQLEEVVENGKGLPVASLKVNVALNRNLIPEQFGNTAASDNNYHSEVFSLRAKERVTREIPFVCRKRGHYKIRHIDLIGYDLFYSQHMTEKRKQDSSLIVYPGRVNSRQLLIYTRKIIGEFSARHSEFTDPFVVRGIRDYEKHDSVRDINWKASAKTGALKVNVHDQTSNRELMLILDLNWDTLLWQEDISEESIRIAAALADEFAANGIVVSLLSNGLDAGKNQALSIGSGVGRQQVQAIRRALAGVRAPDAKSRAPAYELLRHAENTAAQNPNRQITYILISPETNKEMLAKWNELCRQTPQSSWIVPIKKREGFQPEIPPLSDVCRWEVSHGN